MKETDSWAASRAISIEAQYGSGCRAVWMGSSSHMEALYEEMQSKLYFLPLWSGGVLGGGGMQVFLKTKTGLIKQVGDVWTQ